jgi:PAS domain S-box-containing protein
MLSAFVALASLLALTRWQAWSQVQEAEGDRLMALATAAEVNVARRLDSIYVALTGLRAELGEGPSPAVRQHTARHMRALTAAIPGIRQLAVLDPQGGVVVSSGDANEVLRSVPADLAARPVQRSGADVLQIDVPANLLLVPKLAAVVSVPLWSPTAPASEDGRQDGVILALLDGDYFMASTQPLLYAQDMIALLIHGSGTLLAQSSDRPSRVGVDLSNAQSLFTRHRLSGAAASVQQGQAQVSGAERLAALRNLSPAVALLAQPLVLALSRDPRAVHAEWKQQSLQQALALAALMALGWGALLLHQSRRTRLELREEQAERLLAAQAERLELALAGGDLALWDSDLRRGTSVVNARWFQMLGYEDGAFDAHSGWAGLVHPDDLDSVRHTEQAHQEGHSAGFETTYRMRHAQGHWVWVMARGRVVERDAEGRPLRMVGTHMDVTERMQAQEALRHSEQSLAITLSSIGDAVVATDTAGCVTRMNPAAERLTGWPLPDALGLPLSQVFRIYNARTREVVPDPVALVLARGEIVGLANGTVLVARDGNEHQIADSAAPIRAAPNGDILGVVLVFSDVTEQYRMLQTLRDRERQFSAVAEALPGPVSRIDAQGRYLYANRVYESWFGISAGDIVGRTHRDVLGETRWAQVAGFVQRALAGEAVRYESPVRTEDGQRIHLLVNLVPDRDEQGAPAGFFTIATDITERKRAEDALRDSESRVRALLDSLSSGVVVHSPDTAVQQANPTACAILGLSLAQMMGKVSLDPAWHFLEEDGRPMAVERYPVQQLARSGRPLRNFIGGVQRQDRARPLWVLCNGFAVQSPEGELQQWVVTFTDITERKEAEEELRRSEGRLRLAGRIALLGGWRLERESLEFSFTPEALLILQPGNGPGAGAMTADPVDFETALATVDPVDRERTRAALLHSLDSGSPFDQQMYVLRGTQRRCMRVLGEVERDAAGQVVALQGAVQDITDAQRERQQLQLLEACVAQLNDVVLVTEALPLDEPGPRIVFANQAFERLTGWAPAELIGQSPRCLQGPLTDRGELQRIRQALEAAEPVRAELVNYHRSGRPYWIDLVIAPVFDAEGQVTHRVAVQRDVTQRKQDEASLREAQQSLQATLKAVPDLLFELDLDGRILSQHSPSDDLLLQPDEAVLGRQVRQVLPADAASVVMDALRQAHEHGRSIGQQYSLQLPIGLRWFELSVSSKPAPPGQRPRFISLARDITQRKRADDERQALERQLREAQRMESIGTLAGGIAHDFNNILAAILGNVALAREDLPADHAALTSLEQIQRAGQRARSLVQQILTFSRRGPQTLTVQPLRAVVEETLGLLRATLPAGVRVDTLLGDDPLPVLADATQLPQVLMNLCTNAWHALPEDGGRIAVGLEALTADDPRRAALGARHAIAGLQALPDGPCAHLWVQDNGRGMDAATRQRIFDPFFTTKPVGQGTGLGLSVVHGIVNNLEGAIRLDSSPGQGSCFHIFLPLASTSASATTLEAAPTDVNSATRGGHVLYVDDDEVMVLMVQRLLERAGYHVVTCADAHQALALLSDTRQPVDVLVTDFNMPEMSGLDLCRQVRELRPGLPMAISSGYISDRLRLEAGTLGVRALLKKENTLDELPGMVQQLLQSPQALGA